MQTATLLSLHWIDARHDGIYPDQRLVSVVFCILASAARNSAFFLLSIYLAPTFSLGCFLSLGSVCGGGGGWCAAAFHALWVLWV